jgi:hypothetical protein
MFRAQRNAGNKYLKLLDVLLEVVDCVLIIVQYAKLAAARPSAHERFFCRSGKTAAAADGMKRSVLNGSDSTDGCFTAAFLKTQRASFSVRCGGRTAVGGGNGTRKNIPACAHERQNNRTATGLRVCRSMQVQTSWI